MLGALGGGRAGPGQPGGQGGGQGGGPAGGQAGGQGGMYGGIQCLQLLRLMLMTQYQPYGYYPQRRYGKRDLEEPVNFKTFQKSFHDSKQVSLEQQKRSFAEIDRDGNGEITATELTNFARTHVQ